MTKELLERLHSYTCAADAIEALQARVAELEYLDTQRLSSLRQVEAELAAARAQEPVSHRYRFIHPISGEPVWRDSSSTWNGQCVQEVQQLFAAPIPPVREPLSDNTIAALRQAIAQPEACTWTQTDDEDGIWSSSCGELWSFIDGGPKENRVSYCHHCGKKVEVKP